MDRNRIVVSGALWCAVVLMVVGSGCATKKPVVDVAKNGGVNGGETGTGLVDRNGGVDGTGLPNVNLEDKNFVGDNELKTVYFDFDSAALRPDAVANLQQNAARLKARSDASLIQIAGHCDERGTQEYNLALGERRALAVREYLMKLGVPGNRIVTISYGEEVPADPGHDESAWAQNRRGVFNKGVQL